MKLEGSFKNESPIINLTIQPHETFKLYKI